MNILFLTISNQHDISKRDIYADLVRKFIAEGHTVYVVTPFERRNHMSTKLYMSAGAYVLGVKTLNIKKTNVLEKGIGQILLEYQYWRAVKKYISDVHFDLILYTTPPITLNKVISKVKNKYNAKTYLLLKDIFPQNAVDLGMFSKNSLLYKFFRKKESRLYSLSDYIGCMSPANVEFVLRNNPEVDAGKVEVCPNTIELVASTENIDVCALRVKYQIPPSKVMCIYGGNLGKPQGIDFVLRVLESNEKRENCFMLIIGSGTEYGKLKAWFDTYHPCNSRLLSAVPKKEYDCLIKCADIGLIFLDKRFTIPNYPSRLLPYLENRLPIMMATDVVTDIGRIAEENGYGYWVESGDLQSFDCKLDRLVDSQDLRNRMGQAGFEFLENNYSVGVAYKVIMSHFE